MTERELKKIAKKQGFSKTNFGKGHTKPLQGVTLIIGLI